MATNIGHGNERFGSIHEDLLSASPDSDAATAALVNEIKARAKTEFAARNMPAAEALYKKGTEVLATDATLFGNLAAVRIVMGKYSDAVADADGALKADPAWAKGFFRKAQALEKLKRWDDARAAFSGGLSLEPESKVFLNGVARCEKGAEQAKVDAKAALQAKMDAATAPPPPPACLTERRTAPPRAPKAAAAAADDDDCASTDDEDEDGNAIRVKKIRGYKTKADGTKTSFFDSGLSKDQQAKIYGDITPKRIDAASASAGKDSAPLSLGVHQTVAKPTSAAPSKGSAWNHNGTWEEKSHTKWAVKRLKDILVGTTCECSDFGNIEAVKLNEVEGDCSVVKVKGKVKYIFDFSVDVVLEADFGDRGGVAKATLSFPDISNSADGLYETSLDVDRSAPPAARDAFLEFANSPNEGIQPALTQKIQEFVMEFLMRQ